VLISQNGPDDIAKIWAMLAIRLLRPVGPDEACGDSGRPPPRQNYSKI
jgi:hypothetical protein